jgi:hypothetical protein
MDLSEIWDWNFFWSMFMNFAASVAPFVQIPIAILVVGMLLAAVVKSVRGRDQ